MTQNAKPLSATDIDTLRLFYAQPMFPAHRQHISRDIRDLIATIDQQAKQLECGECGNPKGFAILCADCWSHYYRSMTDVTSAAPSDETPIITYWRRNAHEAIDRMIEAQVTARLGGESEAATYLQAHNEAMFLAQQVVNHVTNARLAAARSEKA